MSAPAAQARRVVWVLLAVAAVVAGAVGVWWRRPVAREPRVLVERLLTCSECSEGQMDSVMAAYREQPGRVVPILAQQAVSGPDQERRADLASRLERAFALDSTWIVTHHSTARLTNRRVYVDSQVSGFAAGWRARAIAAVAAVGDTAACSALRAVAADSLAPTPLRQAARVARDSTLRCSGGP